MGDSRSGGADPGAVAKTWVTKALPALAGAVFVGGLVVLAGEGVDRSGAAFTDTASGTASVESGRVDITPDSVTNVSFGGRIGPGATTTQTITVTNASNVAVPAACVIVDVLPVRSTSPNPFSAALGSVLDVTVERKAGLAASTNAWTTVATGNLTALAGTSAPAFGAGLEAATPNNAINQDGAVMDNGESMTYRFTFSMAASVGNTVTYLGVPTTITNAFANAEFQLAAQNVTAGDCTGAVSA